MTDRTRVRTIAREDVEHVRRSRLLWGVSVLVFLLVVPSFWSMAGNLHAVRQQPPPAVQALLHVPGYVATYVFVLVVALAYGSVVGERESGRIRMLLGLPGTRRDVLAGKLLARVLLLVAVLGSLLALLGAIVLVQRGTLPVVAFALVSAWVLLYGVAWTSFTVGLSAAFGSQYRALAAIAGTYLVFAWNAPIWKAVLEPGLRAIVPADGYVASLNPTLSLGVVGNWLIALATRATADVAAGQVAVSLLTLLIVGCGGLVVGYRRLQRADLG